MMLWKNTKVKVRSPDGDRDFFDIVARKYFNLFIICWDYMLQTSIDFMKKNGFTMKKARNRRYSAQSLRRGLHWWNSPAQAKSQQHHLENEAGSRGLHVNVDKTEYTCFNQNQISDISTLTGSSLKTSGQIHQLEEEHLINWKWHQ